MILPQLLKLNAMRKLSYWRFVKMNQCLLSGTYREFGQYVGSFGEDPAAKPLVLGNLFHECLENISRLAKSSKLNDDSFRVEFNATLEKLRIEVLSKPGSSGLGDLTTWPEVARMYQSLSLAVEKEIVKTKEGYDVLPEQELYSKDKLLFGIIDAILIKDHRILVADYKSGAIEDEGVLKPQYVDQLQFYAYLATEHFGRAPDSLSLIDKELQWVDVPYSKVRSEEIASTMRSVLEKYNSKVSAGDAIAAFTTPSSSACDSCDGKVVCPSFKASLPTLTLTKYRNIVWGRQLGPIRRGPRGICAIELDVESGSIQGPKLLVGRLFLERFSNFKDQPGQRLVLTNLKYNSETGGSASELTTSSRIFSLQEGP